MNFNELSNPSFNGDSWIYNNGHSQSSNTLQEPVPFEDFKFTLGMDSNLTTDFPPPLSVADPFLLGDSFNFIPSTTNNNTVLDENDQKAFSTFLDTFFMDPDMQFGQQQQQGIDDHLYYSNDDLPQQQHQQNDDEEHRRSSILQSLDEQKMLHQRLNLLASTSSSTPPPPPSTTTRIRSSSVNTTSTDSVTSSVAEDNAIYLRQSHSISYTNISKKRSSSHGENENNNKVLNKKARMSKELLTEEEKRANHIASEQKRRSTIRNGFKDLTDLIPTLKNINNSKSTVLFKAVDFIRYLEKRNKGLRDKVGSLELRVEVEGRMTQNNLVYNNKQHISAHTEVKTDEPIDMIPDTSRELPPPSPTPLVNNIKFNTIKHITFESNNKNSHTSQPMHHATIKRSIPTPFYTLGSSQQQPQKRRRSSSTGTSNTSDNHLQNLPANARNALLAHKTQQKQLLILQEQLQMHQRLIAQQQEAKERSSTQNKLPPILGQYESKSSSHGGKSSLLKELEDKAISAP